MRAKSYFNNDNFNQCLDCLRNKEFDNAGNFLYKAVVERYVYARLLYFQCKAIGGCGIFIDPVYANETEYYDCMLQLQDDWHTRTAINGVLASSLSENLKGNIFVEAAYMRFRTSNGFSEDEDEKYLLSSNYVVCLTTYYRHNRRTELGIHCLKLAADQKNDFAMNELRVYYLEIFDFKNAALTMLQVEYPQNWIERIKNTGTQTDKYMFGKWFLQGKAPRLNKYAIECGRFYESVRKKVFRAVTCWLLISRDYFPAEIRCYIARLVWSSHVDCIEDY